VALTRRLRAAGVAAAVADDLVARFPTEQVADALDVLPARTCSNAAGWLVRAISDGWQLYDEAARLRATRTRDQQRHAAARALQAREDERDRRLAGWTAAVDEALSDTQLTAAVRRITRPVGGLERRSAPVAASQLLAWAIATATAAPDAPLDVALTHRLHDHASDLDHAVVELPEHIPPHQRPIPQPTQKRSDDAHATPSLTSKPSEHPDSRRFKEEAMHRRHPYGPHSPAALHPLCKSLDNQAHRVALCECAAPPVVVDPC
jgi:hypothetical protein